MPKFSGGGATAGNVGVLDSAGTRVSPKTDDPVAALADVFEIGVTLAKKTTPIFLSLYGDIAGGHTWRTFESPEGTDYQVAASKIFYYLGFAFNCATANTMPILAYADAAVASVVNASIPANTLGVVGGTNQAGGPFIATTANTHYGPFKVYGSVPASKYPLAGVYPADSAGLKHIQAWGIEVDV